MACPAPGLLQCCLGMWLVVIISLAAPLAKLSLVSGAIEQTMPCEFKTTRRVEFRDTDIAGIMHFSVYYTYMEEAEHDFWRHIGLGVHLKDEQGCISWPRVAAKCEFKRPVEFEDILEIRVSIARLGTKSITFRFQFTQAENVVAIGEMTSVCCRISSAAAPVSIAIPDWILEKLTPYQQPSPDA